MQGFNFLFLAVIFCSSLSHAQTVSVFKSNLDYMKGTRYAKPQYFRIPSVVTINTSQYLVAFAEERLGENGDFGDINVVYKFSKNHGKTWSKMYRLCELGSDTCGNPTAVVDQSTGRIHVFMSGNKGQKRQFPKNDRERIYAGDRWILYSSGVFKNGKINFSSVRNMTHSLQYPGTKWDAMGPGVGIQLTRGEHAGRLVIPAIRRTIYSDDHGRTWNVSHRLPSVSSESAIVELADGSIYRNDRPSGKYGHDFLRRVVSFSNDGGENFSNPEKDEFLFDPKCQGSLLQYTKNRIFFANCATTGGPRAGYNRRRLLTIRMTNNGEDWLSYKTISKDCGYSSMTKTRDYKVGILWEKTSADSKVLAKDRTAKDLVFQKFGLSDL